MLTLGLMSVKVEEKLQRQSKHSETLFLYYCCFFSLQQTITLMGMKTSSCNNAIENILSLSLANFSCLLDLLRTVIPLNRKSQSLKVCTIISDFTPRPALAAFVWNPLGVVSTTVTSFLGSKLLIMPGVNERTEERAGVASQGPHARVTKLIAAQWHSQPKALHRWKEDRKEKTEHKACMLMCQLSKLARGWIKLFHFQRCNIKLIQWDTHVVLITYCMHVFRFLCCLWFWHLILLCIIS